MLKEKTAVVTGGSRGIGAAIARKLASLGADIAVLYAGNTEAAESVCKTCRKDYGVTARAYQCDVSDFNAVKETDKGILWYSADPCQQCRNHEGRTDCQNEGGGF